ncbi:MAG: outer membrane lipoprotein carrier protein LolA [Azonexus sp.]|jgi:outer membrane lipoprotein-sorting protein|nr:outer membrane lipoprotein carrier protein LolA [Azonexus sp.]
MKFPEYRWRFFLAALIFLPLCAWADDWQPTQLMQLLAQKKSGRATFVEKKTIAMLDQPLVSSGNLAFTAPDKLEKITLTPRRESLALDGNMLTIERQGKRPMTVRVEEYPEAAAFIEGIRGTLAGDLSALEKFYTLTLTGAAGKWRLKLIPKEEKMSSIFSSIEIAGVNAEVKTITLEQRDGDRSEMLITPVE